MENMITAEQVAERLSVCRQTVLRLYHRGELKGHKFNARNIRFRPEDVAKWVNESALKAREQPRPAMPEEAANQTHPIATEDAVQPVPEVATATMMSQSRAAQINGQKARQIEEMIVAIRANPANHVKGPDGKVTLTPGAVEEIKSLRARQAGLRE